MEGGYVEERRAGASRVDVDEVSARYFDVGRAVWPRVVVHPGAFALYFARHTGGEPFPRECHAPDMYLACACSRGVGAALAAFEQTLAVDMTRAIASVDPSPSFVDDVGQIVRARLFVGKEGTPGKIVEYGGRASLRTWLAAVAVRTAFSQVRRKTERMRSRATVEDDRRLARGPEYEYLRRRYKGAFENAVRDAVRRLSARERMLLRLNVVDGVSIDGLGAVYQVGRSTAARWLASARSGLRDHVVDLLRTDLGMSSTEFESLAAEICSQLDVSILRLLAT